MDTGSPGEESGAVKDKVQDFCASVVESGL